MNLSKLFKLSLSNGIGSSIGIFIYQLFTTSGEVDVYRALFVGAFNAIFIFLTLLLFGKMYTSANN